MSKIYLVDGDWYDFEDRGHWTVAAFTTMAAAEKHREVCQAWADQYMNEFWNAWAAKYGEPEDRGRFGADCHSKCTLEESDARFEFIETWFGHHYVYESASEDDPGCLDETCGRPKMRQLSPDPQVEMHAGIPCIYSVVELDLNPSSKAAPQRLGPTMREVDFKKWYSDRSGITEEEYGQHLVTLRCFCGATDCKGWAAVGNTPDHISRHEDLYGRVVRI